MKVREFNKLLKTKSPEEIISLHMNWSISLTDKQLEKVCSLSKGHGGCIFKYKK